MFGEISISILKYPCIKAEVGGRGAKIVKQVINSLRKGECPKGL